MPHYTLLLRRGVAMSLAILMAGLSGCASFTRIANYPKPAETAKVQVVATPLSKMNDLPVGAYYDEQRHIVVTGHQKGMFAGMMFGIVGVVVADQMNKSSAETKYGSAASHGADLGTLLQEAITESTKAGHAPNWTDSAGAAGLQLTPYAVFTVQKNGNARLYAMLRAELPSKDGKPTWSARYFARAPGEYSLDDKGWMKGDQFTAGMKPALSRALAACVDDTHGRLTGTKKVTAKGKYPFINIDLGFRAIVVQEQPDFVVAKLVVGDALTCAGTHVLDRADYEIAAADFKDPRE